MWLISTETQGPSLKRGAFFFSADDSFLARRSTLAGFTMAELVITLAVTAIVGAAAISAFRTYRARAVIEYTIELARPMTSQVAATFRATGAPPAETAGALWEQVESVDLIDGRLDIRFSDRADSSLTGQVLSLTPFETVAHEVVWVCGNKQPSAGLKPLGFAGGGRQTVQAGTTIDSRFLPDSCR